MNANEKNEFSNALERKIRKGYPNCPFCGGIEYELGSTFATLVEARKGEPVTLDDSVRSGMIVCKNCGHIDFFDFEYLGLSVGK